MILIYKPQHFIVLVIEVEIIMGLLCFDMGFKKTKFISMLIPWWFAVIVWLKDKYNYA